MSNPSPASPPSPSALKYTVLGPWDLWNKFKGSSGGYQFADTQAKFVWTHPKSDVRSDMPVETHTFSTRFTVSNATAATIHAVVDNVATVYVNDVRIGKMNGGWRSGTSYPQLPITLKAGENVVDIEAANPDPPSPGGLLVSIITEDGTVVSRTGDPTWRLVSSGGPLTSFNDFVTPDYGGATFDDPPSGTQLGPTAMPPSSNGSTVFGIDRNLAIALLVCLVLIVLGSSMMSAMMMR